MSAEREVARDHGRLGVACTGCTGEDYAVPGQNALVLETGEPAEFLGFFARLRDAPERALAMRRAGYATARRFMRPAIISRVLLPRVELLGAPSARAASEAFAA